MSISDRISKELLHEGAGLWYISDSVGSKIVVKASSVAIKALMKGCRVELTFGKDTKQHPAKFHSGVRIYDDPVNYLAINGMHRFQDEHRSLEIIMNRSITYVHFYDELNICIATATFTFGIKDQMGVLNLLGNTNTLYTGEFDANAAKSLDCFEHSLKLKQDVNEVYEIDTLVIEGKLSNWELVDNTVIGINDTNKLIANGLDEGGSLEKQVFIALDALFGYTLYRNPKRMAKHGKELTDVFAYSEYGIFLIETKALSVLNSASERTMDRKVAGLKKQIDKAIDQLIGASKTISEQVPVFDNQGNEIKIFGVLPESIPHCIVLVSELLAFGEWKAIEIKMMKAMVENRVYLNVMDLAEFMKYVGISRGNRDRLNLNLIERVEAFTKHQTIHLNAREIFPDKTV